MLKENQKVEKKKNNHTAEDQEQNGSCDGPVVVRWHYLAESITQSWELASVCYFLCLYCSWINFLLKLSFFIGLYSKNTIVYVYHNNLFREALKW